MNRIDKKFEILKKENKKALITYMMAGYPSIEKTKELIIEQDKVGIDILEIGVPFSDPVADGPIIQHAGYQSLLNGTTTSLVFDMIESVRKTCEIPIIFMMYYNTILKYGVQKFIKKCEEIGIDGLIIPDLPYEEQEEIKQYLTGDKVYLIQLVTPTSLNRLDKLLTNAKGFAYCVSSLGVTGRKGEFHKDIISFISNVRKATDLPIMLGFGITEPSDVKSLIQKIDGTIIGSAFVKKTSDTTLSTKNISQWAGDFRNQLNNF